MHGKSGIGRLAPSIGLAKHLYQAVGRLLSMASISMFGVSSAQTVPEPLKLPSVPAGSKLAMVRLPAGDAEAYKRVEMLIGTMVEADCNRHWIKGNLTPRTSTDGVEFHVLNDISHNSTMMGCTRITMSTGPNAGLTMTTVDRSPVYLEVSGNGFLLPYSSRAPIFIQVPSDYSVRYRVYTAGKIIDAVDMR